MYIYEVYTHICIPDNDSSFRVCCITRIVTSSGWESVYMYACMYVCMYACMLVCMHVYARVYISHRSTEGAYEHAHLAFIHTYVALNNMSIKAHVYSHNYARTHTYNIHTHKLGPLDP